MFEDFRTEDWDDYAEPVFPPTFDRMCSVNDGSRDYANMDVTTIQDRQMLALRSFMQEADDLIIIDPLDVEPDVTRIRVTKDNINELRNWLRDPRTNIAFHPQVVVSADETYAEVVF